MKISKGVIIPICALSLMSSIPASARGEKVISFPKEMTLVHENNAIVIKVISFQGIDENCSMNEIKETFLATWNNEWRDKNATTLHLFDKNKFLEAQWGHIYHKFLTQPNVRLVMVVRGTTPLLSFFIEHIPDPKGDSLYFTHLAVYENRGSYEDLFANVLQELAKVGYKKMNVKYVLTTALRSDPRMLEIMTRLGLRSFKESSSPLRYKSFSSLKQQYPDDAYEFYGIAS